MDGEELKGAIQGHMEAAEWRPFKHIHPRRGLASRGGRSRSEMVGRHLDERYEQKEEENLFILRVGIEMCMMLGICGVTNLR